MRPLSCEVVSSSVISGAPLGRANSSSDFISSHGSVFSPRLGLRRTRCQRPLSRAPVEREGEVALRQPLARIAVRHPAAAVPDDHRAAAVFALGDVALEIQIGERMVLGAHRQPLLAQRQARAARHRPALERAVELEPQVVMQPARIVLLHDETAPAVVRAAAGVGMRAAPACGRSRASPRISSAPCATVILRARAARVSRRRA